MNHLSISIIPSKSIFQSFQIIETIFTSLSLLSLDILEYIFDLTICLSFDKRRYFTFKKLHSLF
ncbi:MAG: hypothetical protein P1U46_00375 [Patescibacteria group bacterium]|nr:hypothetical protein [Patescibacteria group bacterium]